MKLQACLSAVILFASLVRATPTILEPTVVVIGTEVVATTPEVTSEKVPGYLEWKSTHATVKGVSVSGNSEIKFYADGNVRFYTRFRAIGIFTQKYTITCGISDSDGNAYTLSRQGTAYGSLLGGGRYDDQDQSTYNSFVTDHWSQIADGDAILNCQVQTGWNILVLYNIVIEAIRVKVKVLGAVCQLF